MGWGWGTSPLPACAGCCCRSFCCGPCCLACSLRSLNSSRVALEPHPSPSVTCGVHCSELVCKRLRMLQCHPEELTAISWSSAWVALHLCNARIIASFCTFRSFWLTMDAAELLKVED